MPKPRNKNRHVLTFVFDLGGVIVEDDLKIGIKPVARQIGIPYGVIVQAYRGTHWQSYMTGRINRDKFYSIIDKKVGYKGCAKKVFYATIKRVKVFKGTLNIVKKLKNSGYNLVLVTDSTPEWIGYWRKRLNLDNLFDSLIISYQVGVRKPSAKIYSITRKKLGLSPQTIVWIDDKDKNLVVPEKLGMRTIRYRDYFQLKRKLKAWID